MDFDYFYPVEEEPFDPWSQIDIPREGGTSLHNEVYVELSLRDVRVSDTEILQCLMTQPNGEETTEEIGKDFEKNLKHKLPDNVKRYLRINCISEDSAERLDDAIQQVENYLAEQKINHEVIVDLFTDKEYTEWKELKLTFKIDKDLKFIYEHLKSNIYQIMGKAIPQELSDKVMVKLERLR